MKRFAFRLFIPCTILSFLASGEIAQAGLGEFFKKLGNSMTKPQPREKERQTGKKTATQPSNSGHKSRDKRNQSPSQNAAVIEPKAQQPQSTPAGATTPPPTEQTPVRVASSIPPVAGNRRDIPFGIPVPNKAGFVTSPYAPNQGFVDVRGFPSGTEVRDPYSNKTFLTP